MSTPRLLVAYASHDGQTRRIAEAIAAGFETWQVTYCDLRREPLPALQAHDRVLVALGIRYGHFPPQAVARLRVRINELRTHPDVALIGVCLSARKPRYADPQRSAYLQRLLRRLVWQPGRLAMFAGALRYPRYRWWEQRLMQLVMLVSGGPTNRRTDTEYTDWRTVRRFGLEWAHSPILPATGTDGCEGDNETTRVRGDHALMIPGEAEWEARR